MDVLHIQPLIVLVVMCCMVYSSANKYSAVNNREIDFEKEEKPFRMKKVNLLWTKGKQKLKNPKLGDLYAELTLYDKLEANLKKLRSNNLDKDGAAEAKALRSYARIVEHFGLDDSFSDNDGILSNEIPTGYDDKGVETQFRDPKLQAMWLRAQKAGFSERDLNMLKEEFQHQQMKIKEFNFVHRELGANADPEDNVVDHQKLKHDMSEEELNEKFSTMKQDRVQLKEGYAHLENIMSSLPGSDLSFGDSRVHQLWAMAKKTNWTQEELDGFKEELKHFEHRLGKHDHYKEKLENSLQGGFQSPERHQALEEKSQFYSKTVKKMYTEFKERIDKNLRHLEL